MIDGCLDWQENGLVSPDVVKQATSDYFEDEDLFGRWIAEKCDCGPGVKGKAAALYECWKEFAIANGEEPGSSKAFAEMLGNRGFKKIKSDGVKYLGIAPLSMTTLNFKVRLVMHGRVGRIAMMVLRTPQSPNSTLNEDLLVSKAARGLREKRQTAPIFPIRCPCGDRRVPSLR